MVAIVNVLYVSLLSRFAVLDGVFVYITYPIYITDVYSSSQFGIKDSYPILFSVVGGQVLPLIYIGFPHKGNVQELDINKGVMSNKQQKFGSVYWDL